MLECPGHTPGSVVFFNSGHRFCFMGDVLFQGSVGRTDLPRGDHATSSGRSARRFSPLGDDVSFIPARECEHRRRRERRANPFLKG